jgi:hypothetical protein
LRLALKLRQAAEQATVKTFLRKKFKPPQCNLNPSSSNKIYKTTMDITMTESGASSSRHGQAQVHFITNSPDIELPEGKRQLLVPTSEYNSNPMSISSFD